MERPKSPVFLVLYAALLILLFYGLVRILGSGGRYFFWSELAGLAMLLFLSLWGFMAYGRPRGKVLFFTVFLLYLANVVLVWYVKGDFYPVLTVLALLGFVFSFPEKGRASPAPQKKKECHVMVFDEPPEKTESKSTTKPVTAYSPAKYVASKNSNVYHEPKCEWARKIDKSRRVWFDDQKEAVEKGYRKHDCV